MIDVYRIVAWAELGCPTEPANIEYDGMTLSVRQWHIDAAKDDPSAIFGVSRFVSSTGDVQYKLQTRQD